MYVHALCTYEMFYDEKKQHVQSDILCSWRGVNMTWFSILKRSDDQSWPVHVRFHFLEYRIKILYRFSKKKKNYPYVRDIPITATAYRLNVPMCSRLSIPVWIRHFNVCIIIRVHEYNRIIIRNLIITFQTETKTSRG